MAGLIRMQEEIHNKILKLRSIEAMISRPSFPRLWEDSPDDLKDDFQILLDNIDKEGILVWIRDHPSLELGERSLTDLKRIAQRLGIKNYSRKGKPELINDIEDRENGTQ